MHELAVLGDDAGDANMRFADGMRPAADIEMAANRDGTQVN
jgi:hypothetical protein